MGNNRVSRWGRLSLAALCLLAAASCRVDDDDLRRWETTQRGPEKLVAVLTHDKYDVTLRIDAALALVRMSPRGGRRVGIPLMVNAVASVDPQVRKAIMAGVVPVLVAEISKPPPVAVAGQPLAPDGTIPFKDAAYSLLAYDKAVLVTDEAMRQLLLDALARWPAADFEHRFDNPYQMYSVEQVVRFVGAPAAKYLPPLLTPETRKIPELARLIADHGDAQAKAEASKKLVEVARYTSSQQWLDKLAPAVREANEAAKLKPNAEQFQAQLVAAQDEQLKRIFGAMKKAGGRAVVDYALSYGADKTNSTERRALAIAALEGNFDQKNAQDVRRILDIASADETPDKVRDLAFRRVGELPREQVIDRLYQAFSNERWQVRWVAAQYAIKMSNTGQIAEILNHLPRGRADNFALTEALSYGDWMGDPKKLEPKDGKPARSQLEPFFRSEHVAARASALGYFYAHGTSQDLPLLAGFESDSMPVPKCDTKQRDCEWKCYVSKPGGKPEDKQPMQINTIGEFVKYCIRPAIEERTAAAAKEGKKG